MPSIARLVAAGSPSGAVSQSSVKLPLSVTNGRPPPAGPPARTPARTTSDRSRPRLPRAGTSFSARIRRIWSRGGGDDALADQRTAETLEGVRSRSTSSAPSTMRSSGVSSSSTALRPTSAARRAVTSGVATHVIVRPRWARRPSARTKTLAAPARTETDCAPRSDKLEGPTRREDPNRDRPMPRRGSSSVVDYLHLDATSRGFRWDRLTRVTTERDLARARKAGDGPRRNTSSCSTPCRPTQMQLGFGRNLESRAPQRYPGPSALSTAYLRLLTSGERDAPAGGGPTVPPLPPWTNVAPGQLSSAGRGLGRPQVAPVHAADEKDGEIGWFGPRARCEGHVAQPRVLYTDGLALPAVSSAPSMLRSPTPRSIKMPNTPTPCSTTRTSAR